MTAEKTTVPTLKGTKNYQIDIMKFLLAICIFIYHGRIWAPAGSFVRETSEKFGWVGVHLFFIISGFFMAANHFKNKDVTTNTPGKDSLKYVWNKIKGIAPIYYATFGINFIVRAGVIFYQNPNANMFDKMIELIAKALPESLFLQMSGVRPIGINSITWYISAMFIAMVPLYYIMKKKPDLFFYILSPLFAIGLFGAFYNGERPFYDHNGFTGIFSGGVIRAICGLCFGVVGYLVYIQIKEHINTKKQMIWLTVCEVLLLAYSAIIWMQRSYNYRILFPWILLFPVVVAIAYSKKSYVSKICSFKIFSKCGIWSTYIYLNHYVGRMLISELNLLSDKGYVARYGLYFAITAISCLISFIAVKTYKTISNRKRHN